MHILGWHIEGFGIFRDFEVRDLPSGIVVFEGPNEAGKSTLLAFLRSVLFGFRGGRGATFEPLVGGNHGGRVFLATRQGFLTVERFRRKPPRIQFEDGTLLSEPEFQQLLGGVDYQTFSSIFAFSLDELRDFASIGGEQISARIFAAGLSGAGPSVKDVIARFDKMREQLLRARSREGEINRLAQEIDTVEQELREARRSAQEYPRLVEEHEKLAEELRALTGRELELVQALEEAKLLCTVWEMQADLIRYREELRNLPPIDEFIFQAREKLADLTARLSAARERCEEQTRLASEKEQEIEELAAGLDGRLLASSLSIKQLVEELQVYNQQKQEKAKLEISLEERRRIVKRILHQLGEDADEERLRQVDTSLETKEKLRRFRDLFAQARAEQIEQKTRLEEAERRVLSLQEEIEAHRLAEESGPAGWEGQAQEITALLSQAMDLSQHLTRVQVDLESCRNAREQQQRVTEAVLRKRRRLSYVSAAALLVLAIAGAALVYVSREGEEANYALGIGLVAGVLVVAAIALGLHGLLAGRASQRFSGGSIDFERKRHLEGEGARMMQELLQIASASGLDLQPLGDDWPGRLVAALQNKRVNIEREAARLEEREKTLAQLEKEREIVCEQEAAVREAFEQAQKKLSSLEETFRIWLSEKHLPLTLSPDGALDFLLLAEKGQEALEECRRLEERMKETEKDLILWERRAEDVLREAGLELEIGESAGAGGGRGSVSDDRLVLAVMTAKVRLEEAEELRRKLETARETARELKRTAVQALEAEERIRGELHRLLVEGGAADESEFLQRAEIFEKRQKLKERIEELEEQLTKTLGLDEKAKALRRELEQGRVEIWHQDVQRLERELEEIRAQRDELNVRSGQLEEQLALLENSANIPELENRLSQLETALGEAIDSWYVAGFASVLLRNTLARYTEERQPRVLAEAGGLFSQVTGGKYARVVALPDRTELSVVDSAGGHKNPGQLSQGTAEQLYLCLRMGLAHEFSRHAEPLPIVMDDVLVNFDPRRRRAMGELLLNFARLHQVLLFTCHPEITGVLFELEPSLRIERMEYAHTSGGV